MKTENTKKGEMSENLGKISINYTLEFGSPGDSNHCKGISWKPVKLSSEGPEPGLLDARS